ncbi:MAG: alpha-1,2-fucosyltransferase [Chryseobacterium sp.]|nr:MAG: alpha-1,2-fucosyltransferase [Chryseobacterium sp.]
MNIDQNFLNTNHTDTPNFTARKLALDIFKKISLTNATELQLSLFKSNSFHYRLLRLIPGWQFATIYQETEYVDLCSVKSKNIYLDGYFQSEKYFSRMKESIKDEFEFPELDSQNQDLAMRMLNAPNSVSVHIRRGDYLRSQQTYDTHGILPMSYYQSSLNFLKNLYPDITLFIFSDDIPWAKENLAGLNVIQSFIEGNDDSESWKDMALMTYCKHHIIANSSFSWWGAWLKKNDGLVYAPQYWFNPQNVHFNIADFVPENWSLVKYD